MDVLRYFGQKHFVTLRSAIADAILHRNVATCTWLAASVITPSLQDPFVYVLRYVFRDWHSFLVQYSIPTFTIWCILCWTRPITVNDPNMAYGPASALKMYIKHVGWEVLEQGKIRDHLFSEWVIHEVTLPFMFHRISDAWDTMVGSKVRLRSEFKDVPDFWLLAFASFSHRTCPRESKVIALYQTLSTLYQDQKRKWRCNDSLPEEQKITEKCPLCDHDDSRSHFIIECGALQTIRDKHSQTVEWVKDLSPWMFWVPLIFKHPWHQVFIYVF